MREMLVHFKNSLGNLSYNSILPDGLYSIIILPQWTVRVWVASRCYEDCVRT